MEYELNKTYLVELKNNHYGQKGDIIPCKRKMLSYGIEKRKPYWFLPKNGILNDKDGFNYACNQEFWEESTFKPFEKPLGSKKNNNNLSQKKDHKIRKIKQEVINFLSKEGVRNEFFSNLRDLNLSKPGEGGFQHLSQLIEYKQSQDKDNYINCFTWSTSKQGYDFWINIDRKWNQRMKKKRVDLYTTITEPEENTQWYFRDNEINFRQLCSDALKSKKTTFIVHSDTSAFVGFLKLGYGYPDPCTNYPELIQYKDYPYSIFEIDIRDIEENKRILKDYAKDYQLYFTHLNKKIKDRLRDKTDAQKFSVALY